MTTRRHFLSTSLGAIAGTSLHAIEPIKRSGKSRMQLGVAAYSFRDYFQWMRDKQQKPKGDRLQWSILDFIDWCGDNHIPGAELTSYFFPPEVDEVFLLEVKRRAYLRGVQIVGTAIGNNFALPKGEQLNEQITYTKKWIDHAATMGAPHIRVFAGAKQESLSGEEAFANCLEAYQVCLDYAAKKGVFLGLENHGGIVALPDDLVKMVRAADSPWAGINFDSGNFHTADPYADLAKIAPYSINVQLKMEIKREGAKDAEPSDIKRVLQILRAANYQGWFTLEFESQEDPFIKVPDICAMLRPMLG
jgi:sugar phosphate isomerase/epimerase